MKTIILLAAISVFLALVFRVGAVSLSGSGPVDINLTAAQQALDYTQISGKTNHTAKATNSIVVYKSSVTNFVVNNDFLVALVANSFNTKFPAGAKLLISGFGSYTFSVVDKTGATNLLNVGSVLSIAYAERVSAGIQTVIATRSGTGTTYSGNDIESYTEHATLLYNDGTLVTADGTHSNFQVSGILMERWSDNFAKGQTKESVTFQGGGGGTIHDNQVVLNGTVTAALVSFLLI